eukprot:COSAG04_NODE_2237_length_4471_cov_1.715919_2_plen_397_part_00
MEAPLHAHDAEAEPQPLPRELREKLRRLVLLGTVGPFAPATRQAQRPRALTWASSTAVHLCATALAFYSVPEALLGLGGTAISALVLVLAVMQAVGANSFHLWRDVLPSLLEQLESQHPVSAKAAKELRNREKGARTQVLALFVAAFPCYCMVAYESVQSNPGGVQWVVATVMLVLAPQLIMVVLLSPFTTDVAFVLAEDRVDQLAARTLQTTAATADFDALADGVYRAHVATADLSQLLQPHVLCNTAFHFITVAVWVVAGVADVLSPLVSGIFGASSWMNYIGNRYFAAGMAVAWSRLAIHKLFFPAWVTSACQRVAEAVNALRVTEGEPAKLATPEQLHRIEGLKRYINELNRDQGREWREPFGARTSCVSLNPKRRRQLAFFSCESGSPTRW